MIPVSFPGGNHYATLLLSLICLATLLTWVVHLLRHRPARDWLADHRRLGALLLLGLAGLGALYPYQMFSQWHEARRLAGDEAAHRLELDTALALHGETLPAGTVLRLARPGQADSFVQAQFPSPAPVAGMDVIRWLRHAPDDWSLILAQDQRIEGWTCSRSHPVELRLQQGRPRLASCHLAPGNSLDDQPLPAGTWLQARPQGWLLRTDGSDALPVAGMDLLKTELHLAVDGKRERFEGLLAHETRLGDFTYPAGTRVASAPAGLSGAQPGDLLFSPSRGRSARHADGSEIAAGRSVLQSPQGELLSVIPNSQAGVLDVASVRLGP